MTTNTDTNNNQPTPSNKLTRFSANNTPFENTSHFLSSTQEITSQQFQSINSNDSNFPQISQLPYSSQKNSYNMGPALQAIQSTSSLTEKDNSIVFENVSAEQVKDSSQKRGKRNKASKTKLNEKPMKRIRTRSDTKVNEDSGIMGLALTALSVKNLKTNESDEIEDDMDVINDDIY